MPTTGPVDAIAWYYQPVLGYVMRSRLRWVGGALPVAPALRVLEIGYGSGVFQVDLARAGVAAVAVDVHPYGALVRDRLAALGVFPTLVRADAATLPFADRSFDAVVAMSTLEFVGDAERCVRECVRVLAFGGTFVCLTPRQTPWGDALARWLSGTDPERQFSGGRQRAQRALATVVPYAGRKREPAWLPRWLAPYELVVFREHDRG